MPRHERLHPRGELIRSAPLRHAPLPFPVLQPFHYTILTEAISSGIHQYSSRTTLQTRISSTSQPVNHRGRTRKPIHSLINNGLYVFPLTGFSIDAEHCLADPFADRSQHDLNANPFDSNTSRNPFEHPNDSAFSLDSQDTARGLGSSQPKPASATSGPPSYTAKQGAGWGLPSWGGGGGAGDASAAEAGIDAREAALRAREDDLRRREEALGMKENNWPPCEFISYWFHS